MLYVILLYLLNCKQLMLDLWIVFPIKIIIIQFLSIYCYMRSISLPSLYSEPKLFEKQQELKNAMKNLRQRFERTDSSKKLRALIQFPKKIFLQKPEEIKQKQQTPFISFKNLNKNYGDQIIKQLSKMRSKSTLFNKQIKAQILYNKQSFKQISQFCQKQSRQQKTSLLAKLKSMEPYDMKKAVKQNSKKKLEEPKQSVLKLTINYHIYESNRICFKPYIDYDCTNFSIGKKGYFLSGRKQAPLVCYDRQQNKWIQEGDVKGLKPFGQSQPTLLQDNIVVFFGGIRFFQPGISLVMNQIQYLNIQTKTNAIVNFQQSLVQPRAYHAQCLYGDFLIISGGVNKNYKILNNFIAYHLTKNYWNQLTIQKQPEQLLIGFAKHKMIPILHKRTHYHIYEESQIIQKSNAKYEGIYIFGGQDGNVELSNKLYIMELGRPSLNIIQPKIKGKYPFARKNFEMIRFKDYIIIQGGRNDQMKPFTLSCIGCLCLKSLQWIQVIGERATNRYSHSIINYKDQQIVIFGGKNDEGLCKQILAMVVDIIE